MCGFSVVPGELPRSVQELLDRSITSVEQLELLLLLHANPDRAWTADAAGHEVRTSTHSAGGRLAELVARRLARETPEGYVFAGDAAARSAVSELGRLYSTHRVRVISRIFAKPPESIRDFADAFRLRKDDA